MSERRRKKSEPAPVTLEQALLDPSNETVSILLSQMLPPHCIERLARWVLETEGLIENATAWLSPEAIARLTAAVKAEVERRDGSLQDAVPFDDLRMAEEAARAKLARLDERRRLDGEEADIKRQEAQENERKAAFARELGVMQLRAPWNAGTCRDCGEAVIGWDTGAIPIDVCPACRVAAYEKHQMELSAKNAADNAENRRRSFQAAWASFPGDRYRVHRLGRPETVKLIRFKKAVDIASRIVAAPGETRVVVCMGATRTGKSVIACAMLAEIIEAGNREGAGDQEWRLGKGARFELAVDVAYARAETGLGPDHGSRLHEAAKATVLVLDELGGEPEKFREQMSELLLKREFKGLLTIVTTGLTEDAMRARYTGGDMARLLSEAHLVLCGPTQAAPNQMQLPQRGQ